jgi:hypothetical protein
MDYHSRRRVIVGVRQLKMRYLIAILISIVACVCHAQSPEKTAERYFTALAESDKDKLSAVVFEPSASRIGKSIIAAAPMFHRKDATDFLEMIFDRVPTPAEIAAMTPMQAFAEYMCDPVPENAADVTTRKVLGVVYERDDLAHVVYGVDGMPEPGGAKRDLISCIKHDGQWRIIVSSKVWEAYLVYVLRPAMDALPNSDAEQSHPPEPADGPASRGDSSPPAR